MKSDVAVLWIDLGPNLNLNGQSFKIAQMFTWSQVALFGSMHGFIVIRCFW